MVLAMNENKKAAIKNRHLFDKNSQMTMIRYSYKISNLKITLYRSSCSQMFYKIVGILKSVLKNFTEKNLCWVYCERKSLALCIQHAS